MQKLLKLLFVLSGTTTLPLAVVACKQEALDNTLNIISKGNTKYHINDFFDKDTNKLVTEYTLLVKETEEMVKKIAETILEKTKVKDKITWYDKNLPSNQNCYNFSINNGKKNEKENSLTWTVNQDIEKFILKVSYQIGTINSEQKFVAKQKIDMTFYIKCGISKSDTIVEEWIKQFNSKNWNIDNPISINLTSQKIDLPKSNQSWSDLDKKVIEATYIAIKKAITWPNTVALKINNIEKTVTKDLKLNLVLSVNLNDARKNTDSFYIWFQ